MLSKMRNPDFSGNTTTQLETPTPVIGEKMKKHYERYNKQIKKEHTLKIVKGLLTAIAFIVTLVCLFLMAKAK